MEFLAEHFTFFGFDFQVWMPVFIGACAIYLAWVWKTGPDFKLTGGRAVCLRERRNTVKHTSAAARESWRNPGDLNAGRASNLNCGSSKGCRRLACGWAAHSSERNSISSAGRQSREPHRRLRRRHRNDTRRPPRRARGQIPRGGDPASCRFVGLGDLSQQRTATCAIVGWSLQIRPHRRGSRKGCAS
jgi:hypothetical protein